MNARRFVVSFGCLLVCATNSLDAKDPAAPPEVEVCKPVIREIADYQDFAGRLEAAKRVDIRPRVSGFLTKVAFKEGSAVKQGELLFELDGRIQRAEMDKAKSELEVAEARRVGAKANLERIRELLKNAAVGKEIFDKAAADVEEAEAVVKVAKASLELAQIHLSFTKITAPMDGTIGRATIDAGNLVKADDSIMATISSIDPIQVTFDIDERTFLRIRRLERDGKLKTKWNELPVAIRLTGETGFPREAKLDSMSSQFDPNAVTLRCRAILPNAKHEMLPGMAIGVRLTVSDRYKAMLVPKSTYYSGPEREAIVFVLDSKDKIEPRAVKLGPLHDGLLVVKEGLKEDDRVVVNAGEVPRFITGLNSFPITYGPGTVVKPKLVDVADAVDAPKERRRPKRKSP